MTEHLGEFNFSFALAQKAKSEIEKDHEKILERINNIVESEKFFINGFPVLKNLINLQPKKEDMKRLSKAIDRLGELLDAFEDVDKKLTLIKTVQENPHWVAWTFGDFSKEIDVDIEKLFNTYD